MAGLDPAIQGKMDGVRDAAPDGRLRGGDDVREGRNKKAAGC
jgi:hypothetical protein